MDVTHVDFSNNLPTYGGSGDDDHSLSSIGMSSSKAGYMTSSEMNSATHGNTNDNTATDNNNNSNFVIDNKNNNTTEAVEDAVTTEAENAVTKERQMLYKENASKLQSILEQIKNSTKNILREMDTYLQETEEVEKTYIRCRANTQKESQRMEEVQPDVLAATQRFMAQGAQLFGGGGAGGMMNFMNMMGANAAAGGGGGGVDSMGMQQSSAAQGYDAMMGMVTPRGNDAASMAGSITGSSMAGSMN